MFLLKVVYHVKAVLKMLLYWILFGKQIKFGRKVTFRNYFTVYIGKGATIEIGDNTFFNHGCSLNSLQSIKIGKDCLFGENVKIYDHNHKFREKISRVSDQGFKTSPVVIGDNCWICSNVVILRGVKVGNHCIIGAGCVVNRDVPSGSIVQCNQNLNIVKMED